MRQLQIQIQVEGCGEQNTTMDLEAGGQTRSRAKIPISQLLLHIAVQMPLSRPFSDLDEDSFLRVDHLPGSVGTLQPDPEAMAMLSVEV